MRIAVSITITMTEEQARDYATEYGLDPDSKAEIRNDVKRHIGNAVAEGYAGYGPDVWSVDWK